MLKMMSVTMALAILAAIAGFLAGCSDEEKKSLSEMPNCNITKAQEACAQDFMTDCKNCAEEIGRCCDQKGISKDHPDDAGKKLMEDSLAGRHACSNYGKCGVPKPTCNIPQAQEACAQDFMTDCKNCAEEIGRCCDQKGISKDHPDDTGKKLMEDSLAGRHACSNYGKCGVAKPTCNIPKAQEACAQDFMTDCKNCAEEIGRCCDQKGIAKDFPNDTGKKLMEDSLAGRHACSNYGKCGVPKPSCNISKAQEACAQDFNTTCKNCAEEIGRCCDQKGISKDHPDDTGKKLMKDSRASNHSCGNYGKCE